MMILDTIRRFFAPKRSKEELCRRERALTMSILKGLHPEWKEERTDAGTLVSTIPSFDQEPIARVYDDGGFVYFVRDRGVTAQVLFVPGVPHWKVEVKTDPERGNVPDLMRLHLLSRVLEKMRLNNRFGTTTEMSVWLSFFGKYNRKSMEYAADPLRPGPPLPGAPEARRLIKAYLELTKDA